MPEPTRLTRQDAEYVARLARIALSDAELELYARQLADVLQHAEAVPALDTDGVPPTAHPLPLRNVLRPDEPRPCLDRDEVLEGARRQKTGASGCRGSWESRLMTEDEASTGRASGGWPRLNALTSAAQVRAGEQSAVELVSRHVAAIEALDGELHAFVTVLSEQALAAAAEIDRRVAAGEDPGPLAGVPVAREGQPLHRRRADHVLVADPRGLASALRRHRRPAPSAAAGASSSARRTSTSSRWAPRRRTRPSGRHATPAIPRRVPGGPRGGSAAAVAAGFVAAGPRLRHRGLDPPAGRAVRRGRA